MGRLIDSVCNTSTEGGTKHQASAKTSHYQNTKTDNFDVISHIPNIALKPNGRYGLNISV